MTVLLFFAALSVFAIQIMLPFLLDLHRAGQEERRERVLAAERRRHEIFEAFVAKQRSKKTKTEATNG